MQVTDAALGLKAPRAGIEMMDQVRIIESIERGPARLPRVASVEVVEGAHP